MRKIVMEKRKIDSIEQKIISMWEILLIPIKCIISGGKCLRRKIKCLVEIKENDLYVLICLLKFRVNIYIKIFNIDKI